MNSDIILKDNAAAVDFHVELVGSRLSLRHPKQNDNDFSLSIGPIIRMDLGDSKSSGTSLKIEDKHGETNISGSRISTKKISSDLIQSDEIRVSDLEIATKVRESLKPGKISIVGNNGRPVIIMDGSSGDISLQGISSLVNKIKTLEREITALKRRL